MSKAKEDNDTWAREEAGRRPRGTSAKGADRNGIFKAFGIVDHKQTNRT